MVAIARDASPSALRYATLARSAGVPRDQFEAFARAGVVLHPKQLAASAAARECDREGGPIEVGYGGARGGGKSHWGLAQVAADDCQRCPGLKCLVLRKVGKSNRENFEDLRRKVLANLAHRYNRGEGVVYFPNGSRILLGHFQRDSDIEAYLGVEYDVILIEEATTLSASKYRNIKTCLRTSKPNWRPRLYNTTNPGGVGHSWYKSRFIAAWRSGAEGETRFIPATVRDNPKVNREYIGVLRTLTGWQRRAWLDGDWDIAAGQFFTNWRADIHVRPRIDLRHDWRYWIGLDYGWTHYTAAYLMAQDGDGTVYVVDEHCERRRLVPWHAASIRAMVGRHGIAWRDIEAVVAGTDVFASGRDGGSVAEDYAAEGITLSPAVTDRINGAAELLRRLGQYEVGDDGSAVEVVRPSLYVSGDCRKLIECIPALEHDEHNPEKVKKWDCDDDGQGGDDAYDALRYGLMYVGGGPSLFEVPDPFPGYRG